MKSETGMLSVCLLCDRRYWYLCPIGLTDVFLSGMAFFLLSPICQKYRVRGLLKASCLRGLWKQGRNLKLWERLGKKNPPNHYLVEERSVKIVAKKDTWVCQATKCTKHSEYSPKARRDKYVIKTCLKNMLDIPNNDMKEAFLRAVKELVCHSRDVTYAASLLANYYVLQRLENGTTIPVLNHNFL